MQTKPTTSTQDLHSNFTAAIALFRHFQPRTDCYVLSTSSLIFLANKTSREPLLVRCAKLKTTLHWTAPHQLSRVSITKRQVKSHLCRIWSTTRHCHLRSSSIALALPLRPPRPAQMVLSSPRCRPSTYLVLRAHPRNEPTMRQFACWTIYLRRHRVVGLRRNILINSFKAFESLATTCAIPRNRMHNPSQSVRHHPQHHSAPPPTIGPVLGSVVPALSRIGRPPAH